MAKRSKKTKRNRKKTPARSAATAAPSALAKLSTAEIAAELQRREQQITRLQAKQQRLLDQLNEVEAEIQTTLSKLPRAGARRNRAPLSDVIAKSLKGGELTIPEIVSAVGAAGYRSRSTDLRPSVSQALLKDDRFERVARGTYALA